MRTILEGRATAARDEISDLARDLIRTPSRSGAEGAAAAIVADRMRLLGYDKVHVDDYGNIVGALFGSETGPTLLLDSHIDTVDAEADAWSSDPFSGAVEGDWLHGLGASDCKGGAAAQIFAGAILKRSLLPLRGNLVVAATVDEENGCGAGMRHLISKTLPELGLAADYVILGEPTSLGLYHGHDGWVNIRITVAGDARRSVESEAEKIRFGLASSVAGATGGSEMEELSIRNLKNGSSHSRQAQTEFIISRRLREGHSASAAVADVTHELALQNNGAGKTGGVSVSVAVVERPQALYTGERTIIREVTNAWSTSPYDILPLRASQSLAAISMRPRLGKWRLGRLGMGTAGGTLVNEFKIPTIGYGPGEEDLAHAPGERVSVRALCECALGTAAIAHALVGIPVCGWTSDEI